MLFSNLFLISIIGVFSNSIQGIERLSLFGIFASSSIVFSAAYTMYMYQKISFEGSYSRMFTINIPDLNKREFMVLLTLVPTVLFGVYPAPILDAIDYSVSTLIYSFDFNLISCDAPMALGLYFNNESSSVLFALFSEGALFGLSLVQNNYPLVGLVLFFLVLIVYKYINNKTGLSNIVNIFKIFTRIGLKPSIILCIKYLKNTMSIIILNYKKNKGIYIYMYIFILILSLLFSLGLYTMNVDVPSFKEDIYKNSILFFYRLIFIRVFIMSVVYLLNPKKTLHLLLNSFTLSNLFLVYVWFITVNTYFSPYLFNKLMDIFTVSSFGFLCILINIENLTNLRFKPGNTILASLNYTTNSMFFYSIWTNIGYRYMDFSFYKKYPKLFSYRIYVSPDYKFISWTRPSFYKGTLTTLLCNNGYSAFIQRVALYNKIFYIINNLYDVNQPKTIKFKQVVSRFNVPLSNKIVCDMLSSNYKLITYSPCISDKIFILTSDKLVEVIHNKLKNHRTALGLSEHDSNKLLMDVQQYAFDKGLFWYRGNYLDFRYMVEKKYKYLLYNFNFKPTHVNNPFVMMQNSIEHDNDVNILDIHGMSYGDLCESLYKRFEEMHDKTWEYIESFDATKDDILYLSRLLQQNGWTDCDITDHYFTWRNTYMTILINLQDFNSINDLNTRDIFIETVAKLVQFDITIFKRLNFGFESLNSPNTMSFTFHDKNLLNNIKDAFKGYSNDFLENVRYIKSLERIIMSLEVEGFNPIHKRIASTEGISEHLRDAFWDRVYHTLILHYRLQIKDVHRSSGQFLTLEFKDLLTKIKEVLNRDNLNIDRLSFDNNNTMVLLISELKHRLLTPYDNDTSTLTIERAINFIFMIYDVKTYFDHRTLPFGNLPLDSRYPVCNLHRINNRDASISRETICGLRDKFSIIVRDTSLPGSPPIKFHDIAYTDLNTKNLLLENLGLLVGGDSVVFRTVNPWIKRLNKHIDLMGL